MNETPTTKQQSTTRAIVVAIIVAGLLIAGAIVFAVTRPDPADSEECRKWQAAYVTAGDLDEIARVSIGQSNALRERPTGCPIPPG